MLRRLGAWLLIGSLTSLLVLVLYEIGVFPWLAAHLRNVLNRGHLTQLPNGVELITALQYGVVVACAFGLAWTTIEIPKLLARVVVLVFSVLVVLLLAFALALRGVLFEPLSCILALGGAFLAGLIYASTSAGRRGKYLRQLLGGRLAPGSMERAVTLPASKLALEGEHREMSVLVCRVFNHGQLRQDLEAADVVEMTNLFVRAVSEFLLDRGAYLDESCPDTIRVFFGAPEPDPQHAARACVAAVELKRRLSDLNYECLNRWRHGMRFGISVVSGAVTTAVYGGPRHPHFSGLGGEIDLARRVCGANVILGSEILVSSATHSLIDEVMDVRPVEMLYEPESHTLHPIFELLNTEKPAEAGQNYRAAFCNGIDMMHAGQLPEALEWLIHARVVGKDDPVLEYHVEKVQQLVEGTLAPDDRHLVADV